MFQSCREAFYCHCIFIRDIWYSDGIRIGFTGFILGREILTGCFPVGRLVKRNFFEIITIAAKDAFQRIRTLLIRIIFIIPDNRRRDSFKILFLAIAAGVCTSKWLSCLLWMMYIRQAHQVS